MNAVSKALRESRIASLIKQKEVAEMLNIPRPFLADIERGRRPLPRKYDALLPEPLRLAVLKARIDVAEEELAALRREQ